ncbi:diaminopimelate epimerase [Candidatus Venteria ishoeyi]|uniref:diaminopimelate epimerase n=1 Tax=Candidatus Venteria ishoeyi TaxID=1899563 RepID=UPI0025A60AF3|nr:diaminopimelate epimerase [Candidatus Venteria ishoeyi]MDM8545191.1 diaminopimelate epimerase [Candidatus Venteria ishoeyi]
MKRSFTKMHGLGNDFVVFNAVAHPLVLTAGQICKIADRHTGIGCDQVLLVESGSIPEVDFNYRIFNADGGEVEQCGNGARCFARFVREQGLTDKDELVVQTHSGIIRLYLETDDQVRVNMGVPLLEPLELPFEAEQQALEYEIQVGEQKLRIGAVSMGNPHAVLEIPSVDHAPVAKIGPLLESHPRFPQRVNVGFMQIINRQRIRLRVFERGSGETLACGTGACAAMVIGRLWNKLDSQVQVDLPGGVLQIRWDDITQPVWMTGPAIRVFEGTIEL